MHISGNEPDQTPDNEDLFIDAVTLRSDANDAEQAFVDVQVGPDRAVISFRLDTGATANVIPTHVF